jgi:hypothetical protein
LQFLLKQQNREVPHAMFVAVTIPALSLWLAMRTFVDVPQHFVIVSRTAKMESSILFRGYGFFIFRRFDVLFCFAVVEEQHLTALKLRFSLFGSCFPYSASFFKNTSVLEFL